MASKEKKGHIEIRLRRGLMACPQDQRDTVKGLGLGRRDSVSKLENTPSVRGMIKKVIHLVEIVSESK